MIKNEKHVCCVAVLLLLVLTLPYYYESYLFVCDVGFMEWVQSSVEYWLRFWSVVHQREQDWIKNYQPIRTLRSFKSHKPQVNK
jgi:hypothetical protein